MTTGPRRRGHKHCNLVQNDPFVANYSSKIIIRLMKRRFSSLFKILLLLSFDQCRKFLQAVSQYSIPIQTELSL